MKSLFLFLFVFISVSLKTQIISFTPSTHEADIKIFFTNEKYKANIIVKSTNNSIKARFYPGFWYWDRENVYSRKTKAYLCDIQLEADFIIYFTEYEGEIKTTQQYLNKLK